MKNSTLATLALPLLLIGLQRPSGEPRLSSFAWADFDGDGRSDALVVRPDGRAVLLRNEGGGLLVDVSQRVGLSEFAGARSASWRPAATGERPELLLVGLKGELRFLRPSEGSAFVDMTEAAGLGELRGVLSASWIDVDGDGRTDLLLGGAGSDELYLDSGAGSFVVADMGLSDLRTLAGGSVDEAGSSEPALGEPGFVEPRPEEPPPAGFGGRGAPLMPGAPGTVVSTVPVGPKTQSGNATLFCADTLKDVVSGACLTASTVATLGSLYPLSNELFVDGTTGFVGVGTTTPAHRLHVEGQFVAGTGSIVTGAQAVVAGGEGNSASAGHSAVSGGQSNFSSGVWSTTGGGLNNAATDQYAVVAGGQRNKATGIGASIGGGQLNEAGHSANVAGGEFNKALGFSSSVLGGSQNKALALESTVGGGRLNEASGAASTVVGGHSNLASGQFSSVLGGNLNDATGQNATAAGGIGNLAAGDRSFAAGSRATASHDGTFVWSDTLALDFASTASQQFLVRAAGGVGLGTNSPQAQLTVREPDASPSKANFMAALTDAGLNVASDYTANTYTPGLFWSTDDDNATRPKAGIFTFQSPTGTRLHFGTSNDYTQGLTNEALIINQSANVGIGTESRSIDARLHVQSNDVRAAKFDRFGSDGELVAWARDDSIVGNVTVTSGVVSYNAFTGSHYAWCDVEPEAGALLRLTGRNRSLSDEHAREIVYGVEPCAKANDPACLGTYVGTTPVGDGERESRVRLVSAVGNGELWVVDTGRDLSPGDLLISSDVAGCAMADDPSRFALGHVVARAAEALDWSGVEADARGLRRARISVLFEAFTRGPGEQRIEALRDELARRGALLDAQRAATVELNGRTAELEAQVVELGRRLEALSGS